MAGLISLTLFLLLTVVISYYGYRRYARPGRVITQLNADHIEVPLVGVTPDAAGPGLLVTAVEYVQIGQHKLNVFRKRCPHAKLDAIGMSCRANVLFCLMPHTPPSLTA